MPTTPKVAFDYFEITNLNAITFSLNATHKNLRFIPEVRYETSNQKIYGAYKAGETPSSSAFQFLLEQCTDFSVKKQNYQFIKPSKYAS
jgi:hypothetical protein